ncbi:MAG TPA: hypothetical protein VEX17_02210, partial [Bacillales bacterium]|nr:hypothetical protein [Bacillales bacterium]
IVGDLGYKVSNSFNANLRYIYGFNTLYWTDGVGVAHDEIKQGNRTMQLGISYFLKMKNSH